MTATYQRNQDVLHQDLDGEGVLYHEATESVHQLNESAFYVWTLCRTEISEDEIVTQFLEKYRVDARRARTDVTRIVAAMREQGLLIRLQNAPP